MVEGGPGPEREERSWGTFKGRSTSRATQTQPAGRGPRGVERRLAYSDRVGAHPIYKFQTIVGDGWDGGKSLSRPVLAVSDAARSGEHSSVVR